MALDLMRVPLTELLGSVVASSGTSPGRTGAPTESYSGKTIPDDLPGADAIAGGELWLVGDTVHRYDKVLHELFAEGASGELEHLPEKTIERNLWRLVCKTWLGRGDLRPDQLRTKVKEFINEHRRAVETWDVLWEIDHLTVGEPFTVADVEFLSFAGEIVNNWGRPEGHPWRQVEEELMGRPSG